MLKKGNAQGILDFRYKEVDAPENAEYDAVIGALDTKLLSLADCDADLRVVDVAAPTMQLQVEEGTADPAMHWQNADGVLVEAQGHGCVLGLQHEIGGGMMVPLAVTVTVGLGSPAGFGLVASGWRHSY